MKPELLCLAEYQGTMVQVICSDMWTYDAALVGLVIVLILLYWIFKQRRRDEAAAIWSIIDELRQDEGAEVRIWSDNPVFDGPGSAIEYVDGSTDWEEMRFTGDNVREALQAALDYRSGKCFPPRPWPRHGDHSPPRPIPPAPRR